MSPNSNAASGKQPATITRTTSERRDQPLHRETLDMKPTYLDKLLNRMFGWETREQKVQRFTEESKRILDQIKAQYANEELPPYEALPPYDSHWNSHGEGSSSRQVACAPAEKIPQVATSFQEPGEPSQTSRTTASNHPTNANPKGYDHVLGDPEDPQSSSCINNPELTPSSPVLEPPNLSTPTALANIKGEILREQQARRQRLINSFNSYITEEDLHSDIYDIIGQPRPTDTDVLVVIAMDLVSEILERQRDEWKLEHLEELFADKDKNRRVYRVAAERMRRCGNEVAAEVCINQARMIDRLLDGEEGPGLDDAEK